ncbi:Eaa protein [Escherichia coli TA206]|nr:Eaa protein [Escherichia coli TA206]
MKQMSLIEMDGFLKGKCIPRDLKVNETNAEYLVRKFGELESKLNEQREYYEGVISDGSKRIAELEKSEEQLINERDHAEYALADMYFAATGNRPEWSNCFSFSDAVDAVVDRIADLEVKQPSPVVPEEKPMPNPLSMYAVDAVAAIAEVRGWNACRAAMLHGAKPVSQTYNLPQTEFEQVADLYKMQFDDGRTCAFHTDAQKAAQWLQTCDGNRVQEYVKLERLQNALSGNYPVTPDGWISCSERMPDDGQHVIILCDGAFVLYAQYRDGEFFDVVRNGEEFFETQSRNVTRLAP